MKYKKLTLITLIILVLVFPASSLAQQSWTANRERNVATDSKALATRAQRAKQHGQRLIDKRLKSLTQAKERINKVIRISDEDKNAIIANLDTAYSGLESLKSQIESTSEDDIETLKSLVESIFYDYRIYSVRLPRERGLGAVGIASYVLGDKGEVVVEKIKDLVEKLEAEGVDVGELESSLEELETAIGEAEDLISDAKGYFEKMQPAKDTTEARNYLNQGKASLKQVREKTRSMHTIMNRIRNQIRQLRPSPTATEVQPT